MDSTDLPKLAAPARRALAGAGITRLDQLAKLSEADLRALHGMGPSAIKPSRPLWTPAGCRSRRSSLSR